MQIYDISGKYKFPKLNTWLSPIYNGESNKYHSELKISGINYPSKWKEDFPTYNYVYPELLDLKQKINEAKHNLTTINSDPEKRKAYRMLADHNDLKGKYGILVKEYGAEIVTNAWLKMYELCHIVPTFNTSMHFAEAPGNFLLAINHYKWTVYQNTNFVDHKKTKFIDLSYNTDKWQWLANSYRDLYSHRENRSTYYLEDNYGLIREYPDRWLFGSDGDGDITSIDNIISIGQDIHHKFNSGVDLVTSDVKFVPNGMNFDEEENINIPVCVGHLASSLAVLEKDGTIILKEFSKYESASLCLLYLICCMFSDVKIVKPSSSRPGNGEVYIVASKYKILPTKAVDVLHTYLKYVRFLNNGEQVPCLFRKEDLPKSFIEKIINIETELTNKQIITLNEHINIVNSVDDMPSYLNKIKTNSKQWLEQFPVSYLPSDRKLIKQT